MTALIVPTSQRYHLPVANPAEEFQNAFHNVLSFSDLKCIKRLIMTGKVEVVVDTETRALSLIPSAEVEPYLTVVFESLSDDPNKKPRRPRSRSSSTKAG